MDGWLVDDMRAFHLVDRVLAVLDPVHPALVPANIMIDERDVVRLVTVAPPAAPYTAPETELTERSNVYAIGVILRELVAAHSPRASALIARCTAPSPAARPSLATLRDHNAELGWQASSIAPYRPVFEPKDIECDLIAAMREQRSDPTTAIVYADWLEQNGHDVRARFLRDELAEHAPPDDARWRAIVSHPGIPSCMTPECPGQWAAMTDTPFDNVRSCARCTRQVHYCTSLVEVQAHARRATGELALDASLDLPEAMRMMMIARAPIYGPPGNPPPPRSYVEGAPPRDNVLTRLFGLFRRR